MGFNFGSPDDKAATNSTASWSPSALLKGIYASLASNQGTQGTGSSYDPPTGGSGVLGYLSGILKAAAAGATEATLSTLSGKLPATLGAKTAANSLSTTPASDAVFSVAYTTAANTSRSGTITTGGTAQQLMAANSSRRGWWIQNLSTADLWVDRFGNTAIAGQPSMKIAPGDYFETPPGGSGGSSLSIYGATTSQAFAAGEW